MLAFGSDFPTNGKGAVIRMKGFLFGLMGAALVKVLLDTFFPALGGKEIAFIGLTLAFLWLGYRHRKN